MWCNKVVTHIPQSLPTRAHKSCFIGDNPMTANLLEGYTFFFIPFFIYPSLLLLQGNLLGGQLEEGSINLDFHYHAHPDPLLLPLAILLRLSRAATQKKEVQCNHESVTFQLRLLSAEMWRRWLQGQNPLSLNVTSSIPPSLIYFNLYPFFLLSVSFSWFCPLRVYTFIPLQSCYASSPWQWFNKQCLQSGLAQSVANYPVTLHVLWDGQD